jgi:hypothetical protein
MNYQKLFNHLKSEHGITALPSEMQEIVNIVEEMKEGDVSQCKHPRDKRVYSGNNMLRCTICDKEFN